MDPRPFTLRELTWLADGAERARWDHTALLWSVLANWMRDPEKRGEPFTPFDVHPYRRKPRAAAEPKMNVADFARAVFGEPPG